MSEGIFSVAVLCGKLLTCMSRPADMWKAISVICEVSSAPDILGDWTYDSGGSKGRLEDENEIVSNRSLYKIEMIPTVVTDVAKHQPALRRNSECITPKPCLSSEG